MRRVAIFLITLYQLTLSPDHSWRRQRRPQGWCRYYPSCSEYTKQAVGRYGVIKGLILGGGRLLRCHPWAEPQVDPVK